MAGIPASLHLPGCSEHTDTRACIVTLHAPFDVYFWAGPEDEPMAALDVREGATIPEMRLINIGVQAAVEWLAQDDGSPGHKPWCGNTDHDADELCSVTLIDNKDPHVEVILQAHLDNSQGPWLAVWFPQTNGGHLDSADFATAEAITALAAVTPVLLDRMVAAEKIVADNADNPFWGFTGPVPIQAAALTNGGSVWLFYDQIGTFTDAPGPFIGMTDSFDADHVWDDEEMLENDEIQLCTVDQAANDANAILAMVSRAAEMTTP